MDLDLKIEDRLIMNKLRDTVKQDNNLVNIYMSMLIYHQ